MGSFVVQLSMYMAYLWGSSKFGESFSTIVQVASAVRNQPEEWNIRARRDT